MATTKFTDELPVRRCTYGMPGNCILGTQCMCPDGSVIEKLFAKARRNDEGTGPAKGKSE